MPRKLVLGRALILIVLSSVGGHLIAPAHAQGAPPAPPPRPDEVQVTEEFRVKKPCIDKVAAVVIEWATSNDLVLTGETKKRRLSQFAAIPKQGTVQVLYSVVDDKAESHVALVAPALEQEQRLSLFKKLGLQALHKSMKVAAMSCS